jgi:hypothetical protein
MKRFGTNRAIGVGGQDKREKDPLRTRHVPECETPREAPEVAKWRCSCGWKGSYKALEKHLRAGLKGGR